MTKVVLMTRDTERKRNLFWACGVNRFTYYREHATEFDSEREATIYLKYQKVDGVLTPADKATES